MKDEELNKLITEKLMDGCWHDNSTTYPSGVRYCDDCKDWVAENPDFCNDHNAIAQAKEKIIEKGLASNFFNALTMQINIYNLIHATPRQQAQAIYEVLKSLEIEVEG